MVQMVPKYIWMQHCFAFSREFRSGIFTGGLSFLEILELLSVRGLSLLLGTWYFLAHKLSRKQLTSYSLVFIFDKDLIKIFKIVFSFKLF